MRRFNSAILSFVVVFSLTAVSVHGDGILTSVDELARLPTSGPAWDALLAQADTPTGNPDVSDQNSPVNVRVLAKALVYGRTGIESYRTEVIQACMDVIGTEGGTSLPLSRELAAYVLAADLVSLPPAEDAAFTAWIDDVRSVVLSGRTLISTHEDRPNNWGTHAGASRIAVAAYIGDLADVDAAATVFRGWLGDRQAYADFNYGSDLSWQADPVNPVGINPPGATLQGQPVGGVLPDDQRRGGSFEWPPPQVNYVYEALQGALLQAILLERFGYDPFEWEDQALLRAFEWLHTHASFPAEGDDRWQPHVINAFYEADFPAEVPAQTGKNVGFTDWLYGEGTRIEQVFKESDGTLRFVWSPSCEPGDDDYAIYSGAIGEFDGHVPLSCSTAGETSAVITPGANSAFYLIVPRSATHEGSYGIDDSGGQRSSSTAACRPQQIGCY